MIQTLVEELNYMHYTRNLKWNLCLLLYVEK